MGQGFVGHPDQCFSGSWPRRASCWPLLVVCRPPRPENGQAAPSFSLFWSQAGCSCEQRLCHSKDNTHLNVSSSFGITQELSLCLLRDSERPLLVGKYNRTKPTRHFKRHASNNGCLSLRHLSHLSGALFFYKNKGLSQSA